MNQSIKIQCSALVIPRDNTNRVSDKSDEKLGVGLGTRLVYWYRELCTIFPYGLNDNVKGVGSISRKIDSTVVWGLFNKHSRRNRKRGRKGNRKYRDKDKVKGDAETLLKGYKKPGFVRTLRGFVLGVAKNCLHELVQLAEVILRDKHLPQYLALIIKDIIRCRRGDLVIHNHNSIFQHSKPKSFIGVYFHNKGIEMINIAGILHSKVVRDTIPTFFSDKETPVVSYKYSKTIRSKLFNHKQTVNEIKFKSDKQNSHSKCDCEKSEYLYHPAGHVLTGDLGIIKDRVLRKLISKGPSFREQNNINWQLNYEICAESVKEYKRKWANKEGVDKNLLNEWEGTVLSLLKKRIDKLKGKYGHRVKVKQILRDRVHLQYLKDFQDRYVLVPADKAGNNVIIICKTYYTEVICKELATKQGKPQTYHECSLSSSDIIQKHLDFMKAERLQVPLSMHQLPSFYWLPKLHKDPYGNRFIAASNACTTKPLSQLLTACLTSVLNHYQEYCKGIFNNSNVNSFWVINNSIDVLKIISNINNSGRVECFDSYDFSTLYTSIPHQLLKDSLKELIMEAFLKRGATYLVERRGRAYWSTQKGKFSISVTESQLVQYVEYLIDNNYIYTSE